MINYHICEFCGKKVHTLFAETVTSQFVCSYCYSNTLNPYLLKGGQTEHERFEEIEALEYARTLKNVFKIGRKQNEVFRR
jgi:hypothetical protein